MSTAHVVCMITLASGLQRNMEYDLTAEFMGAFRTQE